jgi:hypothetical protein
MANDNDKPISFLDEVYKRTGKRLDPKKIAKGHTVPTTRVRVDNEKDPVARMALEMFRITDPLVDSNPVAVLAALQLTANVLGESYLRKLGSEETQKIVVSAQAISALYQPEYKHGDVEEEQMAAAPEDEPVG